MDEPLLPPHGGYRDLQAYQLAEIIFDGTVAFCERLIDRRSRTVDQMVQAARSGKQNIAEGSMVSGTSKKMEIKLISVARGSLEELLVDLHDYLRLNDLSLWPKDHPKAVAIRKLAYLKDKSYMTYKTYVEEKSPETAANTLICITHQANFLLDQLKRQLSAQFLEEGGFTERLYRVRTQARKNSLDSKQIVD
ncbi:MAG: four helix bundle suffix domain-containing protein [Fimbriimonadaceae bacterium]|nr:four helix bundle suffix domain-containing protein [Fimbriimonadaceae bacterium]